MPDGIFCFHLHRTFFVVQSQYFHNAAFSTLCHRNACKPSQIFWWCLCLPTAILLQNFHMGWMGFCSFFQFGAGDFRQLSCTKICFPPIPRGRVVISLNLPILPECQPFLFCIRFFHRNAVGSACQIGFAFFCKSTVCRPYFFCICAIATGSGVKIRGHHFISCRQTFSCRCLDCRVRQFCRIRPQINLTGYSICQMSAISAIAVSIKLIIGITTGSDCLSLKGCFSKIHRHFMRNHAPQIGFQGQFIDDRNAVLPPF